MRASWPVSLAHYYTLSQILDSLDDKIQVSNFRLWLTRETLFRLAHTLKLLELDPSYTESAFDVPQERLSDILENVTIFKALACLRSLQRLEIYIPQYSARSPNSHFTSEARINWLKDKLANIFGHVRTVRFWRALSENATSGEYVAFHNETQEAAPPPLPSFLEELSFHAGGREMMEPLTNWTGPSRAT
jgi:hypothetical protein